MTEYKVGDKVRTFYFGVVYMAEIVEIRGNRFRLRFTVAPDNFRQPDGLVREHWRSKKVVEQDNGFFPYVGSPPKVEGEWKEGKVL